MEAKCDDMIKLMRLKMEHEAREKEQENTAETEGEGSEEDANELLLQPQTNQGFSAFGAKPISCDVSKNAVGSSGHKHLDAASHTAAVAEQCDSAANGDLDSGMKETNFAAEAGDAGAGHCSSDADWHVQTGGRHP